MAKRYAPLLWLSLYLYLSVARAISIAAARVQTTFVLLPSLGNCPQTITHRRLALYRGINPDDPNGTYDGLLWKDLEVNARQCVSIHDSLHSTVFEVQPTPQAATPSDTQSPWFLIGNDNSVRRCDTFAASLRASYLFTDDLPRFRARFVRDGLLEEGVATEAKRDTVFMFVVPFSNGGTLQGPPCTFVEEEDAQGVVSVVQQGDDGADADADVEVVGTPDVSRADVDDGPACLGGDVMVCMADGTLRRMDALRRGDVVRGVRQNDVVISFSHIDARVWTNFVQVQVLLYTHAQAATSATFKVSADHLLLSRDGASFAARDAREGMELRTSGAARAVVNATSRVWARGVFAPVTEGGVLVVQGDVVVSCYSDAFRESVAHALLAPVRAFRARGDWAATAMRWLRGAFVACSALLSHFSSANN